MTDWWAWGAICFLAVLACTPLALAYARRRQLLDSPGARRSHSVTTPRGGGIAIVVVMLGAIITAMVHWPGQRIWLSALLLGTFLVAIAGWIDDHRSTSPWWRLSLHALAGLLLAAGALSQGESAWAALAAFVLSVHLVNIWNFMDGIDGIATTQAAVVAAGVAWFGHGPIQALGLALLAACLGFLPFNFPRARIFLGDVGSGALGFLLAALIVAAAAARPQAPWWLLALPLAAFVVDAAFTLLRRMVRGERWWEAHVQHVYQRLARALGAHMPVTLAYLGWSLLGLLGLALLTDAPPVPAAIATLAWLLASAALWWHLHRRHAGLLEPAS